MTSKISSCLLPYDLKNHKFAVKLPCLNSVENLYQWLEISLFLLCRRAAPSQIISALCRFENAMRCKFILLIICCKIAYRLLGVCIKDGNKHGGGLKLYIRYCKGKKNFFFWLLFLKTYFPNLWFSKIIIYLTQSSLCVAHR